MAQRIQPLPADVVHLIAAGEVIDSLAAVVRELIENALDAGATRIAVSLWPEQWRVRVADNGTGMDLANLQCCATAHSTSKIHSSEDLWKITSLGFRGEALHSLAQLADLEILSRPTNPAKEQGSWRVVYNAQGEPIQIEPAAIACGTVVDVCNLFGTWQARRQGLPSPAQQLRLVQLTIHQLALCHPHVTWQVEQNDRRWFSLTPGQTPQYILPQLLRDVRWDDLHQVKIEVPAPLETEAETFLLLPSQSLELVLGLPDRCHRRRPDWVKVAINGRMVRTPELEQTLLSSFARTLPRDRYPICFLHLRISPEGIDWNRHPAKAEIYLLHLNYWQEQIANATLTALQLSRANLPAAGQERVSKLLKASEEKGIYSAGRSIEPAQSQEMLPTRLYLRAIAQVHNTYILAEHPGGLWLVEQHIAHERVLYEQLCDRWHLVPLEAPAILNQLTPKQIEQLQRIGIEVDPFGEQVWAVRTAPALLAEREDCTEALLELSCGDLQAAQVATACRSAIRNGTPLSLPEMQTLLDRWQSTRHPRTCPHGRPIYLSLEETDLARFFRRHWVIGKSHGI
ncbi:MAG: DNA mismatch repair endonuclease MutL [Microcoleus vaginatus WJT46-NPBG5]|jgi:DNA mismatch repair protein MutL|nr:DNA mismatch repair endonuclease MutL [Microcoleus vaginatus WJT46-NPBG5]